MSSTALTEEYIVAKLDELPTLPTIVYELSQVINDPMSSSADVEQIMSNDISLTAKVLKLANSAYYAIPGGVSSLARAISFLGFDTVNQLVLSTSVLQALEFTGESPFDMGQFWTHCIGVGIASETIAKVAHHPLPSDMFTSGLIHDMGKVALLTIDSSHVMNIAHKANEEQLSYLEAEQALDLPDHATIGYLLAQKWQLPSLMQMVIKNHHVKSNSKRGQLSADVHQSIDIVFLANIFIHALKFGNSGHSKIIGASKEVMERIGMDPIEGYKKTILEIKTALGRAEGFIKIIGSR